MRAIALLVAAWFFAAGAWAADRVALLIGNNNYVGSPLRNAVNDARDLAETLKELGFHVIVRENATRKDMIDALREYGTALEGANTALFFYAGHAMQFKDSNYLIPIDAAMGSEEDITFYSIQVAQVFDRMEKAKTRFNFIVLDACRDNPFASSFKASSVGLAQMSAPPGTLIAYATSPGSVAQDGFERNGVYTKHILKNIKVANQPVEIMFKRVREGVVLESRRQQTPWDSTSLKGDFTFAESVRTAGATPTASTGPSADTQANLESLFWGSVKDSNRADDIQAYLDKYPNGHFAQLARNRLNALTRPGTSTAAASRPAEAPTTLAAASPPGPGPGAGPRDPAPEPTSAARSAPPPQAAAKPAEKPVVVAAAPASAPAPSPPPASTAMPASIAPATAPTVAPPPAPKKDEQPGREIAPGIREVVFADGSTYRGAMRGTVQHGKGEYTSKVFQYQGEFKDGRKHGSGVYTWESGDRYEGEFSEDRQEGMGKWRFATGDVYEGEIKAGKIMGRGSYTYRDGSSFVGAFQNGTPHGVGVYSFANGDRYEGEMVAGVMSGKGRFITKSGDKIDANFANGLPQGKGVYIFSNGDRYEGEMSNNALTGVGSYTYASGHKYEGELVQGRPQGRGVYHFSDGHRFEGVFDNGLARAKGESIDPKGQRSPAEMVDGNVRLLN